MTDKKYYAVKKKYLADALNFIGFKYYKFTDNGITSYSFEDTEDFRSALTQLNNLKNKYWRKDMN